MKKQAKTAGEKKERINKINKQEYLIYILAMYTSLHFHCAKCSISTAERNTARPLESTTTTTRSEGPSGRILPLWRPWPIPDIYLSLSHCYANIRHLDGAGRHPLVAICKSKEITNFMPNCYFVLLCPLGDDSTHPWPAKVHKIIGS